MAIDLEAEFKAARKVAEDEKNWYARHRWGYIIGSWALRGIAILLLIPGSVLPLTEPSQVQVWFFDNPAQAAVACLLVAGLLLAVNNVFMVTATWSRYTTAMMKIKTLIEVANWDWKEFQETTPNPSTPDDFRRASEIRKALVLGSRQVVDTETEAWSSELSVAVDKLQSLINDQKRSAESLADEYKQAKKESEEAAAKKTLGAIRIEVGGAVDRIIGKSEIFVNEAAVKTIQEVEGVHVIPNLAQGIAFVRLEHLSADNSIVSAENAVQVVANNIVDLALNIPSK